MKKNLTSLLLLHVFVLAACAPHLLIVKESAEFPAKEAESILAKTVEERADIKTVKFKANIKIDSKRKRFFFKQLVLAKKPDKANLTVIKFGTPLTYIAINRDKVTGFDPKYNRFFEGEDVANLLEKYVGVRLDLSDFIEFVFGGMYLKKNYKVLSSEVINRKFVRVLLNFPGNNLEDREIWIDADRNVLVLGRMRNYAKTRDLTFTFLDHREVDGILFPHIITVRRENPFFELRLKIKDISINKPIDDEQLLIKIPPETFPMPLERLEGIF